MKRDEKKRFPAGSLVPDALRNLPGVLGDVRAHTEILLNY